MAKKGGNILPHPLKLRIPERVMNTILRIRGRHDNLMPNPVKQFHHRRPFHPQALQRAGQRLNRAAVHLIERRPGRQDRANLLVESNKMPVWPCRVFLENPLCLATHPQHLPRGVRLEGRERDDPGLTLDAGDEGWVIDDIKTEEGEADGVDGEFVLMSGLVRSVTLSEPGGPNLQDVQPEFVSTL